MDVFTHIFLGWVINGMMMHVITNDQAVQIVKLFYSGLWG